MGRDTLTVTSAEGGEYTCVLIGTALPPKPQGPIAVKSGGSAQVNVKNVLADAAEFTFTVEPSCFTVAKPKESIPAKKATQVGVSYKAPDDAPAGAPVNGKLTASGLTASGGEVTFVYYLQGTS